MRLCYIAGPGDIVGTFRHWQMGSDDPSQVAVTYSAQVYDLYREHDIDCLALSRNRRADRAVSGRIVVENRPELMPEGSGWRYHRSMMIAAIRIMRAALKFRADILLIADGSTNMAFLWPLKWFRIPVIASYHCAVYHEGATLNRIQQVILSMEGWFLRRHASGALSVSVHIIEQIKKLAGDNSLPCYLFNATYRRETFEDIPPPDPCHRPFRVLYLGRIEENKGVFDLLKLARRFASEGRSNIVLDLCGTGSALDELRGLAEGEGLTPIFQCHGHCDRSTVRDFLGRSHLVIVPTRSNFVEGTNKVVIEGALAGRPVVTSRLCGGSIDLVREAIIEVPPDDVQAYGDAVIRLCDDPVHLAERINHAQRFGEIFFDPNRSFRAAICQSLKSVNLM